MAQYTFDSILGFNVANCVLPSGYTKQLSLISDGKQYILLPSTNGNPSGICISFRVLTPYGGDKSIYGQINNSAPYLGQYNNTIIFGYKSGTGISSQVAIDSNKHVANINYNGDKKIILDGNLLFTATAYYTNNNPLAIFNAYYNSIFTGQPCEIFYAEPTINDTNGNVLSKMTLIPASNGSDLGLYDIENDIFYTNNGTGTFTSGGNAPTYNFQNGDEVIISSTKTHYHYQDGDLVFWYQEIPPLVFKGITFEQTDYWQKPEMVFRGFCFEITDKTGGASMFHGMN
jgi:hypothetical protein